MLVRDKNGNVIEVLTQKEFSFFIRNFRGLMIYRGKVSISYKFLNFILYFFKENFWEKKNLALKEAIKNLLPFVGMSKIRRGRKVYVVPVKLKEYRRYVIMNDWILRRWRNYGRTRGIDLNRICQLLNDTVYGKGILLDIKDDYTDKALDSRYILMQKKGRGSLKFLNILKRKILKKKKQILKKKKRDFEIYKIIKILKFQILKKKDLKLKFRKFLLKTWKLSYEERLFFLLKWILENKKEFLHSKIIKILKLKNISKFKDLIYKYEKEN